MILDGPVFQEGVYILQPHTVILLGGNCWEFQETQIIQHTRKCPF